MFEVDHVLRGEEGAAAGFTNSTMEDGTQTEVGRLLSSLSNLPTEIQLIISANCTSSFLLSLVTVANTSSALLSRFKNSLGERTINLLSDAVVDTLYAESTSIFGQSYISDLRFNDSRGISVRRSRIEGIKFVIGRYGIQALSILYADDTTSSWLGDPTQGWVGVTYGGSIRHLHILQDVGSPR